MLATCYLLLATHFPSAQKKRHERRFVSIPSLLLRRFLRSRRKLASLELFYAPGGIQKLGISGKKRVARAANFNGNLLLGRTHVKIGTARAFRLCIGIVFRMYFFLHSMSTIAYLVEFCKFTNSATGQSCSPVCLSLLQQLNFRTPRQKMTGYICFPRSTGMPHRAQRYIPPLRHRGRASRVLPP